MVRRLRFLTAVFGLLLLNYPSVTAAPAPTLYTCPNVQIGVTGGSPAVYSDCYMDFTNISIALIPTLFLSGGDITFDSRGSSAFLPQPSYSINAGAYTSANFSLENMGSGYSGSCAEDMDSTLVPSLTRTATANNVYCGRISSSTGESIWLRTTFNGTTLTSPLVVTNAASAAPPATPSVPVPTLPLLGLLSLGGLIGLFGIRKLKN